MMYLHSWASVVIYSYLYLSNNISKSVYFQFLPFSAFNSLKIAKCFFFFLANTVSLAQEDVSSFVLSLTLETPSINNK